MRLVEQRDQKKEARKAKMMKSLSLYCHSNQLLNMVTISLTISPKTFGMQEKSSIGRLWRNNNPSMIKVVRERKREKPSKIMSSVLEEIP